MIIVRGERKRTLSHMVLGLDFGVQREVQIHFRAREWRCGEHGEWSPLVTTREESWSKNKAVNYRIINILVGGIVTESHVAAYSALAEREHLCRERCRVVIASVEDGQQ